MTDDTRNHAPTPEFRASLEDEMVHAFRRESQFAPPADTFGGRRLAKVLAFAACTVLVLGIGLVWGVGTGLAAAHVQDGSQRPEAFPLAVIRNMPVRKALTALSCAAATAPATSTAQAPAAQQGVPIIDLPPAPVKTSTALGVINGVREVPGGKLLVNDARRRQLRLYDTTLANVTVVMDSTPGTATSYGPRPLPLLRYLGDSSITADVNAGVLLMLGPTGEVARAVASPYVQSGPPFGNLTTSLRERYSGVDDKGRILFNGFPPLVRPGMSIAERVATISRDSVPIMRVDLDSRHVDTVAFTRQGGVTALMGRVDDKSPARFSRMPVEIVDAWGVLSDGSIGIVRGHDYHIDWIHADGTTHSTPKLPFDWKRLTDEDKQRLIDSTRIAASAQMGNALSQRAPPPPSDAPPAAPGARVFVPQDPRAPPRPPMPVEYVPPELKDIPDYYPSIRISAAIADLDGNLWILPNTSAQSRNGELVYDVVNVKGDFHRVRLPVGRSIVGFGKGGVVYLESGDRTDGFYLERTRLPGGAKTTKP
jgi:hypothetical protein